VVPLRTFIQEVLKRSRTTYSTLQTALFYLFRARPAILTQLYEHAYISCGRRMFLASLVIASKFVQDKTYRNSAWAKIAGLPVSEINAAERIFLELIDYRLYIAQPTFEQWHHLLHLHVE
ncbi:cyclin PHO80-like protein, partial [Phascolomyces articulosus]